MKTHRRAESARGHNLRMAFNDLFKLQSGFTTIEMIVCLGVVIQLLVLFASYVQKNTGHLLDNLAAQQLATVHKAARYYVQDHFTDLFESFNSSTSQGSDPISISLDDLKAEHYLSEEQSKKNVYQQGYKIIVSFQDMSPSGTPTIEETILQLLVYTKAGSSLKEASLRTIANGVGGPGGYVSTADPQLMIGACQGWKLQIPSEISISTGHNVALSYLSQKNMLPADSFLRRFAVDGNSDLSIMHTHLGMDQKFKVQFLDTDAQEDLNGDATKRTFWDKNQLQFGEKCQLTETGLVLKDDNGNEMHLTPKDISFSSNHGTAQEKTARLNSGGLQLNASNDDYLAEMTAQKITFSSNKGATEEKTSCLTSDMLSLVKPNKNYRASLQSELWSMHRGTDSSLNLCEIGLEKFGEKHPYLLLQGRSHRDYTQIDGWGSVETSSEGAMPQWAQNNQRVCGFRALYFSSSDLSKNLGRISLCPHDFLHNDRAYLELSDFIHNRHVGLSTV